MRLIDADALKESVLKWLPHDSCGVEENEQPYETDICVSMLMEIEEAPTIEPERWIPCSERLPELDEDGYSDKVLVCFSNFTGCEVCEYRECDDCHGWYVGDSDDNPEDVGVHVIAWMPLPEPYREGEG